MQRTPIFNSVDMRISSLCATLLPLFLFGNTLYVTALEKPCLCKDTPPNIQRVAVHGNISVTCPNLTGQEMNFMMYLDKEKIASCSHVNNSLNSFKLEDPSPKISFHVNRGDNSTSFVLHNVTVNQTNLYRCVAERVYPPPLIQVKEQPRTIVIVEENRCQQNLHWCDPSFSHLPLWVGLVVMAVYGFIMTSVALSLRSRLRTTDITMHDYMNMKPRARRKNQGVLHPTRLSWYSEASTSFTSCNKLSYKHTS